jgi:hypothetical protein
VAPIDRWRITARRPFERDALSLARYAAKMQTLEKALTSTPRPVIAGLGLLAMAIVNAGCTERSASHRAAAMSASAAEAAPAQPSPAQIPATPAGAQFSRWLEAFNSGNRETLLAYHEQHFPYSVASADVAGIDRELQLSLGTNGFTEKQVEQSTPTALTLLLQERARPQFARVHLEVEPSAPHRVVQFEIGPIPTPLQFLSGEELAQRNVDAARRDAALDVLSRELEAHYVFAELAQKMSERLSQKAARGDYDAITDAVEFAQVLTGDLQEVSRDKHLRVRFGPMPPPPPPSTALSEAPPPWIVAQNFGFGPMRRQPGNVALLALNGFVPLLGAAVEEAIGARMSEIGTRTRSSSTCATTMAECPRRLPSSRAISSSPRQCCSTPSIDAIPGRL